LRHKRNVSPISDFTNGSTFHRLMRNNLTSQEEKKVNRVLLCSGKIYFELQEQIEILEKKNVFILRLEQLYPFPYEAVTWELERFPKAELIWVQEEPKNMGAWGFVKSRIDNVMQTLKNHQQKLYYIGRRAAASPATGVYDRHLANQKNILRLAIEADVKEIRETWAGVSLVTYKLPIE